jgi:hypothetical protein
MKYGAELTFMRVCGVELLIIYNGVGVQQLGPRAWAELTGPGGIARYVTIDIFGFPSDENISIAPGFLGWFYLVGGNGIVILGLLGFTLGAFFLWKILAQMKIYSLPVAQTLFLFFLLNLAIDGVLESIFSLPTLAYPTSIAICEWFMRLRVKTVRFKKAY